MEEKGSELYNRAGGRMGDGQLGFIAESIFAFSPTYRTGGFHPIHCAALVSTLSRSPCSPLSRSLYLLSLSLSRMMSISPALNLARFFKLSRSRPSFCLHLHHHNILLLFCGAYLLSLPLLLLLPLLPLPVLLLLKPATPPSSFQFRIHLSIQGKLEPSPSGGPLFPASPSSDSSVFSDISPDITSAAVSKMAALSDATSAAVAAEAMAADAAAAAGAGAAEGDVMEGAGTPPVATGGGGGGPSIVIVGAGPAGLFAALELVEVGMKPIIVERGM